MLSRLTMAARYSCTVLVSLGTVPSVSLPVLWVTTRPTTLGQSGINVNQHVKRRTLYVCVGLSDFRQRLTADYTTGPVCCLRQYTGVATPRLHACKKRIRTTEQLNTWLSRLHSLLIRQVPVALVIRQAEELKQLVDEASRFHLGRQRQHYVNIYSGALLFSSRVLHPSLVMLCAHKSVRCAVELYHAPHLWYSPFYTSPMASSALQH